VAQALARYDEFAEWYEQWIGDAPPLIAAHSYLLPAVAGDRVLDIACVQGRMTRYLARLGADVVGVDISAAMLDKARATGPEDIAYVRADVARHPA
jgi:2-polyprenyl-3-methyl-5-hydroxy-6-metoxy-1,4-benzoquinol methylase